MSGVLSLNATDAWMPSVGAYDAILEAIANELRPIDAELADTIEARLSPRHTPFLDLSTVAPTRLRCFLDATSACLDRMLEEPAVPFGKIRLTSQLEALLRIEPRIAQPDADGDLVAPSGVVWRASGWIYDLVLAHIAAAIKDVGTADAAAWAKRIASARIRVGAGRCDLHELPTTLLLAYTETIAFVTARLGGGGGLDTVAPRFNQALVLPLSELAATSPDEAPPTS